MYKIYDDMSGTVQISGSLMDTARRTIILKTYQKVMIVIRGIMYHTDLQRQLGG